MGSVTLDLPLLSPKRKVGIESKLCLNPLLNFWDGEG
jgi:hypothetical protein